MVWALLAIAILSLLGVIVAVGIGNKQVIVCGIAVNLASGISLMVVAKPWFQWLWFSVFYMNPSIWIAFAICVAVLAIVGYIGYSRQWDAQMMGGFALFVCICWVISIIVFSCIGNTVMKSFVYDKIHLTASSITALDDTTKIRYLPMEVAEYYGENRMQEPGIMLGDFDAITYNGEFAWVAPREQSGVIRQYTKKNDGVAIIHGNGSMTTVKATMQYGEGMQVFDNIGYLLANHNYWVKYPEIYYLMDGETPVAVAPYISYSYDFPVMVPEWGGVVCVYPDGTLEDYTPEEALGIPFLANERIFPEELARLYAESYVYVHGIWNTLTSHTDQVRIPHLDYSDNQMPYLLPTEDGLQWVVVAEPASASFAIHSIFFIDAVTGELGVYRVPLDTNLIGPDRGWEYVKAAFPSYDWVASDAQAGSTGNIQLIEPRPVINKGVLYWMITIATKDYAFATDKPSTVLVNSETTEVTSFFSEQELVEFLYGTEPDDGDSDGGGSDTGGGAEIPSSVAEIMAEIDSIRTEMQSLQGQMEQDQLHLELLQADLNMHLEQLYDMLSAVGE